MRFRLRIVLFATLAVASGIVPIATAAPAMAAEPCIAKKPPPGGGRADCGIDCAGNFTNMIVNGPPDSKVEKFCEGTGFIEDCKVKHDSPPPGGKYRTAVCNGSVSKGGRMKCTLLDGAVWGSCENVWLIDPGDEPGRVCLVTGKVTFKNAGGSPAIQSTYVPPVPPGGNPYPSNPPSLYNFVSVNFVCAGEPVGVFGNGPVGVCNAASHGTVSPAQASDEVGRFEGQLALNCTIGSCNGSTDGLTFGPFIAGSFSGGCGVGVLQLTAVVDPTLPNYSHSFGDANGDGVPDIGFHYDCIIVTGVAIVTA